MTNSTKSKSVAQVMFGNAIFAIIKECAGRTDTTNETIIRTQDMIVNSVLNIKK